jgi:methyl-accepting chemotaxis protein
MTQQNAALVEESAAAAESLKEQARKLNQVVATFQLGDEDSMATRRTPAAPPAPVKTAPPTGATPAKVAAKQVIERVRETARPVPTLHLVADTASHSGTPVAAASPEVAPQKAADDGDWETF